MSIIYVDADGCPVKDEVYRVAGRYTISVKLVANCWMRVPQDERVELVVVGDLFDAADDWIVDRATDVDIVVTGDIPLAARCLTRGAAVLSPRGRVFTEDDIGQALAVRELISHIRDSGTMTGGPPPFEPRDRSLFLQKLDQLIQQIRRRRKPSDDLPPANGSATS